MTRLSRFSTHLAVLVVATALQACGSGGGQSGGASPALTSITAAHPLPTSFTVTGVGFPNGLGTTVAVDFVAEGAATPFWGGASAKAEVSGTITSDTTVVGLSPAAVLGGLAEVRAFVTIRFAGGFEIRSATAIAAFRRPIATGFSPPVVDSEIARSAQVIGADFGPPGRLATVTFLATSGTPFAGGTSATRVVPGVVASGTAIDLTTPVAAVTVDAPCRVEVDIPEVGSGSSAGAVMTFAAPAVTGFSAATVDSEIRTPFTITGTGLAGPLMVRFVAESGTPFLGGTAAEMLVAGTASLGTEVTGTTPRAGVAVSAAARVQLVLASGAVVTSASSVVTFAPPGVTGMTAASVPCLIPTAVSIDGSGFAPNGSAVVVRFTATTGTPFSSGTSATADVSGTVASPTSVLCTTPTAQVCGPDVTATIQISFAAGARGTSASAIATFQAPSLEAIAPAPIHAWSATPFLITGLGFAPAGGTATVQFTARSGTPFDGSATASASALIDSATSISGLTPTTHAAYSDFTCTVSLALPDGSCATLDGAVAFVTPRPRFAYVANFDDGTLSIYRVDAVTGQLHHCGYVLAGTGPRSVTVDPSGRFAYVANQSSHNVTTFAIDPATGALTEVGSEVAAGSQPVSVTVDPTGRFAYVANAGSGNVTTFCINPTTGALTEVGTEVAVGTSPFSVTVDPSGRFAYVSNGDSDSVTTFSIHPATGALTEVGTEVAVGNYPRSVTVDPTGRFAYVANQNSNDVTTFSIDQATGALTEVGTEVAAGSGAFSVGVDPSGRFAYVANQVSNDVTTFSIDATTGALTKVGAEVAVGSSPVEVTVDPSGRFAYATNYRTNDVTAFRIHPTTGALTAVGVVSARAGPFGLAMTPAAAEPVTVVPKFAYVANEGSGNVTTFSIHSTTGALTEAGTEVAAGSAPFTVTLDPSGRFAYVANRGSDNVTTFRIDATTGALSEVGTEVAAGSGPRSVAVEPSGRFAYVTSQYSSDVTTFRIDASTGALTEVGTRVATGSEPHAMTVDPSGRFVYTANFSSNNVATFRIDSTTGALSEVGTRVAAGSRPFSVTVDPSGRFAYAGHEGSGDVRTYSINSATGALTQVGSGVTIGSWARSVAVGPSVRFAYAVSTNANTVTTLSIDPTTGALTKVGTPVAAGNGPESVTVDPSGRFAYVANLYSNDVTTFLIDPATGELTELGSEVAAGTTAVSIVILGVFQ